MAKAAVPGADGIPVRTLSVRREGSVLYVAADGPARLLWRGAEEIRDATAGLVHPNPQGTAIRWDGPVAEAKIRLRR